MLETILTTLFTGLFGYGIYLLHKIKTNHLDHVQKDMTIISTKMQENAEVLCKVINTNTEEIKGMRQDLKDIFVKFI